MLVKIEPWSLRDVLIDVFQRYNIILGNDAVTV